MCRIPLVCLGWEKISVVQTSPRPAASTLQALRIGKYLEGHLSKPLHAALFTPSPTRHTCRIPSALWNFLYNFPAWIARMLPSWCSSWCLQTLLIIPPVSHPSMSLLVYSTHIWQCLSGWVPSPGGLALAEFFLQGHIFLVPDSLVEFKSFLNPYGIWAK